MVINSLLKNKISKLHLPSKIMGVYPVLDANGDVLVNIEAIEGSWVLKSNEYVEIIANNSPTKDVKLVDYCTYSIKRIVTGEVLNIIPSPDIDPTNKRFIAKKNQIVICDDPSADICFKDGRFNGQKIVLTRNDNKWIVENTGVVAYINNRYFKKRTVFHGDWLYIYGLKTIIVNDTFIINNPNNLVTINTTSFENKPPINQNIVYQTGVAEDKVLYEKDDYFNKAPRFKSIRDDESIVFSPPPKEQEEKQDPAILQIGPRLTMSIMSFYTLINSLQQVTSGDATFKSIIPQLMSVVLMMTSSFLWPTITKKYQKRMRKKDRIMRTKKYNQYLEKKEKEIKERLALEKQILIENNVSLQECQAIIYNKRRNLWERNIADDDFLTFRIGTGNVESNIKISEPNEEAFTIEDETTLKVRYKEVVDTSKYIDDAPMDISLTDHKIVAVVGNNVLTKYFFDSMFLQLTTFHSFRDLKIFVITNQENDSLWDYMRIMPHCWDNYNTMRYFSNNPEDMNAISASLEQVFKTRISNGDEASEDKNNDGTKVDDSHSYRNYKTYYLIFIDDLKMARNIPIIKEILKYQANLGFSIIIRNDKLSNLPSECKTFIDVEPDISGLFESDIKVDNQKQFKAELNREVDMYGCALQLANIPIPADKAKFELPSSISFLTMYNVGKVEHLNSLDRWKKNNPVNSLAVPIGINSDGDLFKMDIHEKAYGPHGLVAGTTGSGKSEWIITYILSLAVNFHPDEVQFVLIDYKGGGLALSFENKDMGIKLPHLAGTITNLDKSAINRALTSIEAELKRRQRMFNEAREKLKESSMDIYKYQQCYRKGLLDEPISHLLLISDEFAELKSQEPEFLDQLVSTARIGRSLGVHLILATQKPSGVVSEQIWSNSRFKVCLRVQDKSDSQSMIKTPDAAMLKTAGAFYLQVGYNELYTSGQSAYAGAKYYPSDIVKKELDDSVQYIDNIGASVNSYTGESNQVLGEPQGEELLNVVRYISDITKGEKVFKKQLWLPNVDTEIYLDDLKKKYDWKFNRFDLTTAIGEYDNPTLQSQGLLSIDFSLNTAIYGESGSGKENLLATIIWSSLTEHTPEEVNYYLIDYGAETLRMFAKYPHVGEVAFQGEPERVAGVLQMVFDELARRKELFADYNGNYVSYLKESGKELPRWIVVINAWDVFNEVLGKVVPFVESMFRDCAKYGISFICSTTTSSALKGRRAQNFENLIMLHLQNDFDYRDISMCQKGLIPQNNFGRGVAPIAEGFYCEFQTAFITKREEINPLVRKNADNFAQHYKVHAKSLPKIPDNVTSDELSQYITDLTSVPIGYNFHEKDLAKFDFLREKMSTICVDDIQGQINSIYGIINILSKVPGTIVRVIDLCKLYAGSNLDIKHWDDKFEAVLLALTNDMKKRTLQQDHGINIILGAGLLKSKLNDIGKDVLNDYMESLSAANKTSTILIDTYQRLKTLKIEPWFAKIDNSYGMWIGSGIDSQNIYNVKDITMEERKLNYNGMAYIINNADYTLIKTILDEE